MIYLYALSVSAFLATASLLWLIAYLFSPAGKDVSLWRGIVTALVLFAWNTLCESVIDPRLSHGWGIAATLVGMVFVVKWGFRLTFLRSLLVSVIYCLVIGFAVDFILNQPDEADRDEPRQTPIVQIRVHLSSSVVETPPAAVAPAHEFPV